MNREPKSIAYVAPEIPGASSTFVYNEIIEVEQLGIQVQPFSLHSVETVTLEPRVREIACKCTYLYDIPLITLLNVHARLFIIQPSRYCKSFANCVLDVVRSLARPRVAIGLIYRFFVAGYLAHEIKRKGLAHIHAHFSHIAADVSMYAATICGIPFSFTAHANDIFERGYLLREKSRRAKFVATISNFNINKLMEIGVKREKLRLVRCGVDTEKFSPREATTTTKKQKVIGFLGRLVEKKGVDLLVRAVDIVIRDGHAVRLEVMGNGPLLKDLQILVERLKISDYVDFGGALTHNNVSSWFESIDYFVFPGKIDANGDMDGIPVVLMEAMMRGVPVIATRVSGIPELVRHNETGRLANAAVQEIAENICAAMSESEEERARKVSRAIRLVKNEFNLADNTKKLVEHFELESAEEICPTSLHS